MTMQELKERILALQKEYVSMGNTFSQADAFIELEGEASLEMIHEACIFLKIE